MAEQLKTLDSNLCLTRSSNLPPCARTMGMLPPRKRGITRVYAQPEPFHELCYPNLGSTQPCQGRLSGVLKQSTPIGVRTLRTKSLIMRGDIGGEGRNRTGVDGFAGRYWRTKSIT